MKHWHHVIPKHMGGSDDPSNLVELTVEEHAEAHRVLYEKHGHWEDRIAWLGLAGILSREELVKQMLSEAGKRGNANRKGMKYVRRKKGFKPQGTVGLKWFHDPENPSNKGCFKDGDEIPAGWIRGQGKKARNPGLNFHRR